jgi:hypothetical protein
LSSVGHATLACLQKDFFSFLCSETMKMIMKRTTLYIALFLLALCGKDALAQQSLYGLRLQGDALGNVLTLKAPAGMTTYTLTFPSTHGTLGQVPITIDAAGTLGWLSLSGNNTGDVTKIGESYLTLTGQQISANPIDLTGTNVTGQLKAASFPILFGDITTTGGTLSTSIAANAVTTAKINNNAVTYGKIQNTSVNGVLLGSPSTGSAIQEITLGSGFSLVGSALTAVGLGGTVTSVSVVTANGISGLVATPTTTPAITLSLGNITPTTVNGLTLAPLLTGFSIAGGTLSKTLTVSDNANVSGTNTGDISLTQNGGETYLTLAGQTLTANLITYANMQAMTANKLLGSGLSGTSVAEITLGTGLSYTGTTLNVTGAAPTGAAGGDLLGSTYPNPVIAANAVSNAKFRQSAALSVVGNGTNATANVADISGTSDQVLRVNTAGNALAFGTIATGGITNSAVTYAKLQNAVGNNIVLGNIAGANQPYTELTSANLKTMLNLAGNNNGDVTLNGPGSYLTLTGQQINQALITYANMQAMTANKLLGSGLAGTTVAEITLGAGLSFTGTTLNVAATGFATPTGLVNVSAPTAGSATTAMRSDATLQLDQTINPAWTGNHSFGASSKVLIGAAGTGNVSLDLVKDFATREVANSTNFVASQNDVVFDGGTNQCDYVRLGGSPLVNFTITSIANPVNGKRMTIYNATGKTMTLSNLSASGTPANGIITGTGSDVTIPSGGLADLVYSGGTSGDLKWILNTSSNGNASTPTIAANTILGNNTGSAAAPIALTVPQVKTMLNLTGTNSGDVTLAGAGNYLTLAGQQISQALITYANMQPTAAASVLLGRNSGSAGALQEITLGPTLSMSALGVLSTIGLQSTTLTTNHILVGNAGVATDVPMTGDVGIAYNGGNGLTTIQPAAVTLAKMANFSAVSLMGNPTGSAAAPSAITLGAGLAFSGTTLTATGSGGTVTNVNASGSQGVTIGGVPFTTSGTIAIGLGAITPTSVSTAGNISMTGANGILTLTGNGTGTSTITTSNTQGTKYLAYTLPAAQPAVNNVLTATSLSGSGTLASPYAIGLGWTSGLTALSGVQYGPAVGTTQNTLDVATNQYLFDISYSGTDVDADAAGARITSASVLGDNSNATALTLSATATGSGIATGLNVTVAGPNTDYAAIFSGGNVGIGQSTPTQLLEVHNGNLLLSTSGTADQLQFQSSNNHSGITAFQAGNQGATNLTYTLPTSAPAANSVLYSSGGATNNLSWTNTGSNNQVLMISGGVPSWQNAGSGTVTSVSVVSANGFGGSVATPTSTPAITISTSVNGLLKGNGTSVSAATSGTDYSAGTSALSTGLLKSTNGTGVLSIAAVSDITTLLGTTTYIQNQITPQQASSNFNISGQGQASSFTGLDGTAGAGSVLVVRGGNAAGGSGAGGALTLSGGSPLTNGAGGAISLTGGNGAGNFSPGNISLNAGNGAAAGSGITGGSVSITAGTGSGTSNSTGGPVTINGGLGGAAQGTGGSVTIAGGSTPSPSASNGGNVIIQGGDPNGGQGGLLTLRAGNSTTGAGSPASLTAGNAATTSGGTLTLAGGTGGTSSGTGTGGPVLINGGAATTANNTGGAVTISGGIGIGTGNGGAASLKGGTAGVTGSGGAVSLIAGNGVSGAGGAISVTAGNGIGTNQSGGGVTLSAGNASGTGSSSILFQTAPAGLTGSGTNAVATNMTLDGSGNLTLNATGGQLKFTASSGGGLSTFQSGNQSGNTFNYTLPTTQPAANSILYSSGGAISNLTWSNAGTANQVLTITGGVPSWQNLASGGSVTNVSVVTANGVSGVVSNPTTTPAITLTLGAITPTSVIASGAVSGTTLTATNNSNQLVLGSTHPLTISTSPTATYTYTIGDMGANANFALASTTPVDNTVPLWNGTAGNLENSSITDDGSTVSTTENITMSGAKTLTLGTVSSNTGSLALANGSSANLTTIQAGNATAAVTYKLPTANGSSGQMLTTDGNSPAQLSWSTPSGTQKLGRNTTDQTNASGNALANATGLSFTVGTSEVWAFTFNISANYNNNDGNGIEYAITLPTGATIEAQAYGAVDNGNARHYTNSRITASGVATFAFTQFKGDGDTHITGTIATDATHSGTVQLQFESAGNGTARIYTNSHVVATKF